MTTKIFPIGSKECDIALKVVNLHQSILYHMFLGWRGTVYFTGKEAGVMRFLFTEKDLKIFEIMLDSTNKQ